jgi:hypothetical protein
VLQARQQEAYANQGSYRADKPDGRLGELGSKHEVKVMGCDIGLAHDKYLQDELGLGNG